jgi:hypothetical protein
MKKLIAVVAAAVAAAGLALTAAPVHAASHTHYGETSRHVAQELGCKRFVSHGGGGTVYKTGVCYLKVKRVNVITFKNVEQQRSWNIFAKAAFGSGFFWGNGKGALVVAKNGNRPAAMLGADRLPGRLVHG